MSTATGKLEIESGCNAKRQPSFKSETLVISAVKALGSTFTMATTPSSTHESRPQSQTKGLDSGTPAQHPALSYTCQPFVKGLISMIVTAKLHFPAIDLTMFD